jgi:hypothetical protein
MSEITIVDAFADLTDTRRTAFRLIFPLQEDPRFSDGMNCSNYSTDSGLS